MKTQGPVIGVSSEAQRPSAVGRKAVTLLGSATSPTPSKKLLASPEPPPWAAGGMGAHQAGGTPRGCPVS